MDSLLVYGSYGYTGRLIVSEAVSRGGAPIVAGRDAAVVADQAESLGLEGRAVDLESPALADRVADVDAVLNCAGPFARTAGPLVDACLTTGTDYLDVTGEFGVFERLRQRDHEARAADAALLPGVGFDVVPSDCLAKFLRDRLPDGDRLSLGIRAPLDPSGGTLRTVLEQAGSGGVVRRNGRLISVPQAFHSREIDFGDGPEHAVTAPLGDVVTAPRGTGIDSVEVYVSMPRWAGAAMSLGDAAGWLLERGPVGEAVDRAVDALVDGPDEGSLATDAAVVWGELVDESTGRRVRGRLHTPNVYALTADAAVSAAERTLEGGLEPGFRTPGEAFGADFVLGLEGTSRELLESPDGVGQVSLEADD